MRRRSKQHHCRETRRGAPGVGGAGGARGGHEGEGGGETQVEDKMSCILLQIGRVTAGGGVMLPGEVRAEMVSWLERVCGGAGGRGREEEREGAGSGRSKGHTAGVFLKGGWEDCDDDGLPLQQRCHSSSLERHGEICRLASTS